MQPLKTIKKRDAALCYLRTELRNLTPYLTQNSIARTANTSVKGFAELPSYTIMEYVAGFLDSRHIPYETDSDWTNLIANELQVADIIALGERNLWQSNKRPGFSYPTYVVNMTLKQLDDYLHAYLDF